MQQLQMFETLSPNRLFIRCAIPSMISMAMTSLYTVVDGIFVGRFIGSEALAAVSLSMPFIMITFALSDMIAVGSSVQIAIRLGEKKEKEACQIFSFCVALIIGISFVVGLLAYFLAEPLMLLMGATPTVTELAVTYIQVFAVFSPVILIFFAVDNYLRICGKFKYSMAINVILAITNIFLDALFIGYLGWGIDSAAFASCLSLSLGTLLGFIPFLRGNLPIKFTRPKIALRALGNIFANGSSEFFSTISGSVMMVFLNVVLLHIAGTMAVAAFAIVMYIDSIVKALIFGMGDALQPAISYNYGAKNGKRLFSLEKRVIGVGAAISLVTMFLMLLFADILVPMFLTENDPELLNMSIEAMKIFSLSYLVCWFNILISLFFTAIDRPLFSILLALCQVLLFPILSIIVLASLLGLLGVWFASLSSNLLTAIIAVILLIIVLKKGLFPATEDEQGEKH